MGEGNGNGKAPVIGLWNECVPENLVVAQMQFACVRSSVFFKILDPDVFCRSLAFFRNPVEHFHPKGGSRYIYMLFKARYVPSITRGSGGVWISYSYIYTAP